MQTSVVLNRYINHGQVSEDDFSVRVSEFEGGQVSGSDVVLDLIYISVECVAPSVCNKVVHNNTPQHTAHTCAVA